MTVRPSIVFTLAIAAALMMLAHSATAAKGGKGGAAAVVIDTVEIRDLPGGAKHFEILGGGFDAGGFPSVTLDDQIELQVLDLTATTISAKPGANTPAGDFTLEVSTGRLNQQNASTSIHLGGTLTVVCIDWYLTTGPDHHIHVEGFVQDENGDAVEGAAVMLENTVDGEVYQMYSTTTFKYAGYNHGDSCPLAVAKASGATGQFCCIGLGAQEPFCPSGLYESEVLSVQAPPGSNAVWDGVSPDNGREFTLTK